MTRLQPLSEADVRLRLYPSTGRVVKASQKRPGIEASAGSVFIDTADARWFEHDGERWAPITVDAMLSDEARLPISDTIKLYMQGSAARHFRLKAMGLPCDCSVCEPRR